MLKIADKSSVFLVVVDIQEKLLPTIYNKEEVVENTIKLIKLAETLKFPVVVTEQYPKGLGYTIKKIEEAISSEAVDFRGKVEKLTFSCVREPKFTNILTELKKEGYNEPVICGIEAHICVYQTIMDLLDRGYTVHLALDAVGSRKRENHVSILDYLLQAKVNVKPTETLIFEMLVASGTPDFKKMLPYLK